VDKNVQSVVEAIDVELKLKPKSNLSAMLQILSHMIQLEELIESVEPSEEKNRAKFVFSILDSALAEIKFDV
jgi:hypothetical protein